MQNPRHELGAVELLLLAGLIAIEAAAVALFALVALRLTVARWSPPRRCGRPRLGRFQCPSLTHGRRTPAPLLLGSQVEECTDLGELKKLTSSLIRGHFSAKALICNLMLQGLEDMTRDMR